MTSIFHGQPPHTYFNKSFEDDPDDALFLCLNEIDPLYLRQEHLGDNAAFECHTLNDPRTGKAVQQVLYDHTKKNPVSRPKLFHAGGAHWSSLTKDQHAACLRVQRAWQEGSEVHEEDLLLWRQTQPQRQAEKQQMLKFVYDYAQGHKEQMYAPTKRLVDLYKKWYALQAEMLLQREPETTFNTHVGMPHVRVCGGSNAAAEIADVRVLQRSGWMPVLQRDADYRKLHIQLETFGELFQKHSATAESSTHDLNTHLRPDDSNKLFVPLESLLFVLTAGEYCDLPTEVLLDIEHDLDSDFKSITFQKPLPARHCGFHTHKAMLQQAIAGQRAIPGATEWLRLDNDRVSLAVEGNTKEILATQAQQQYPAVLKFDEYLEKYKSNNQRRTLPENSEKFHAAALVQWALKDAANSEDTLSLYSTLPLPLAAQNCSNTEYLATHTVKLEYKPQFGCEVMTKYELLELWLQMRLLHTPVAYCTRISAAEFETQLAQPLTLAKVEQDLLEMYQVKTAQLLAKLAEFLRLLLNMGAGRYLLRYNPKFRDKLMLCVPSREITQNTVSLHALLRSEPSDLMFMTQLEFLPIADDLCSIVHLYNQVLPCAFRPNANAKTVTKKKGRKREVVNDRQWLLKRVQKKAELAQERELLLRKTSRKAAKARKRKQKRAGARKELDDATALQQDIEADQLLFG